MSASVTWRVRRVGRTGGASTVNAVEENPGADVTPAPGGAVRVPGLSGVIPTFTCGAVIPTSGMSPGFGIGSGADADVVGAADGSG